MTKKDKVGDIIYPHYNGSTKWYKRTYWEVIRIVYKGKWLEKEYWYSQETAKLRSQILKLEQELKSMRKQ